MKAFVILFCTIATLALLAFHDEPATEAAPQVEATLPSVDDAPPIERTIAPPLPSEPVAILERERDSSGGRRFDLPAKATRAPSVQAPQRRVVFRGCGIFGRRCR